MAERPEGRPDARKHSQSSIISEQRQLINLAYRLLGSMADAEDIVQDAYARWYALSDQEQDAIASPGAWLSRVTGRLAINDLKSARSRREHYVGEWIPEPVPNPDEWISGGSSAGIADPARRVILDESVTMAVLVVLDAMTPAERVAFVLHDVFRYPFGEVSEIVGRAPAACRQLASSARRRLHAADTSTTTPAGRQGRIVREFKHACETGNVESLVDLLDMDATAAADGGGLVSTAPQPVRGADQIVRYARAIVRVLGDTTILVRSVNGQPGLVLERKGAIVAVVSFHIVEERIQHIWAVRNPEKLRQWR